MNTGTLAGTAILPIWTTGKFGCGLSFTSANSQYVKLLGFNPFSSGTTTQFSISGWFDFTTLGYQSIIAIGASTIATGTISTDIYMGSNDGTGHYPIYFTINSVSCYTHNNYAFSTGIRYNIISAYNNGAFSMSINGADQSLASSGSCTTVSNLGANSYIGIDGHVGNYINAQADDIRFYNYALSTTQQNQLYNWVPAT